MNKLFYLLALYCIFSTSYSFAEFYEVKIAPLKVYNSMLENYKNKNYSDVDRAILYVEPVLEAIESKFDLDLNSEIQSGLKARDDSFYIAIKRLIFYDIQVIFTSIPETNQSPDKLRVWFKISYDDYLLLSSILPQNKENFTLDRKIKKMFQKTYICLGSESPYGKKISPNLELFRKYSSEIIKEMTLLMLEN